MEECYQPVVLLSRVVWYPLNPSWALAPHPSHRDHCYVLSAHLSLNACSTKIGCRLQGKSKTCSWIKPVLLNCLVEVPQEIFYALVGVYNWQTPLLGLDMHWTRDPSFNVTLRILMAWWLQGKNRRNLSKEPLLYMNNPLAFKTKVKTVCSMYAFCTLDLVIYLILNMPYSAG